MRDGTSNVLLFGEAIGGLNPTGQGHEVGYSWMGSGMMVAAFSLNPKAVTDGPDWSQYSSQHAGGVVQFCFGDGAVRGLDRNIDDTTFRFLAGMHDRNHVNAANYVRYVAEALAEQGYSEPQDVQLGDETLDEMCLGLFGILVPPALVENLY